MIDRKNGGTFKGMLAAINHVIELSIPKSHEEGGTYIVPGHGRICDQADVVSYRDMVTMIEHRIADLVADGKTLEQVYAAQFQPWTSTAATGRRRQLGPRSCSSKRFTTS